MRSAEAAIRDDEAAAMPVPVVDFPAGDRPWSLTRGATLDPTGGVRFAVWAPAADEVSVHVLTGPRRGKHPLEARDGGIFTATVAGIAAGVDYRFVLARGGATLERPDPVSRFQPEGVHGPSRVVDPHAFAWRDERWRGLEMPDYVLYELHVGTFTAEGTFDAVIPHLQRLRDLGVTALELMPVAQFPGSRNWGYDGVDPYAAQNTYGGPDALRRLVDAAHAIGLGVVLDVVYNHLGPEGNYLADFGPYFTDRYRTPWGPAVNYDDAGSDQVRRYVIENALYWITELHVDGLRLDAVHAIFDFSAWHILDELATMVRTQAARLGRRIAVIAESDLDDPRLVRTHERGGYGLDAQWSDDFHHAVHVALTGERQGYYEDFTGVAPIATALRDRFVYGGRYSSHRRRRHGAPATDVPAEHFVVFMQNHDQVGNRAAGERLSALVSPAELRLAAAALLLAPYVPLLFMGEEYGATNPFLYFVSHGDPALVEAVRQGRRREFAAFAWQGEVPDPHAEATFARSRLNHALVDRPGHAELHALYRDLLRLRRTEALLRPGVAAVAARADGDTRCVSMALSERGESAAALIALFNFSREPREIRLEGGRDMRGPLPHAGRADSPVPQPQLVSGDWTLRLSTDAAVYGGADATRAVVATDSLIVTLAPSSAALLGVRKS